jgi:hypothetical protein
MRARLFIFTAILAGCAACTPQPRALSESKQTFRDVAVKICWGEPADCNASSPGGPGYQRPWPESALMKAAVLNKGSPVKRILWLALFVLILLASSPVFAADYYVATTGNDSNSGAQAVADD